MFGFVKRIYVTVKTKGFMKLNGGRFSGFHMLLLVTMIAIVGIPQSVCASTTTPQAVNFSVTSSQKEEIKTETSEVRVVKIWDDEGDESKRPAGIEVQLCRGETVVETVVLNQKNNWQYHWTNLETDDSWTVREVFSSDDYVSDIERKNHTYYITNTYVGESEVSGGKLPQTGMLWWPVPVLVVGGMVCCFSGWKLLRRRVK